MKNNKLPIFIQFLIYLVIGIGGIALFFLPKLYDSFSNISQPFQEHTILYQIAFYLCYLLILGILGVLSSILELIKKGTPFKKEMEHKLKIMSVLFLVLATIVIIKFIFIPTLLSLSVAGISFVVGLSFYVLSQVFKIAISYKDEIDYTV